MVIEELEAPNIELSDELVANIKLGSRITLSFIVSIPKRSVSSKASFASRFDRASNIYLYVVGGPVGVYPTDEPLDVPF